jgi:hypothetical protein
MLHAIMGAHPNKSRHGKKTKHKMLHGEIFSQHHTKSRRDFADALIVLVGNEQVAVRVDGYAVGTVEAGVGPGPVGISTIRSTDPARKR